LGRTGGDSDKLDVLLTLVGNRLTALLNDEAFTRFELEIEPEEVVIVVVPPMGRWVDRRRILCVLRIGLLVFAFSLC